MELFLAIVIPYLALLDESECSFWEIGSVE